MKVEFNPPAKGATATWEEFETALKAVDWSFHVTEDEEAIASYVHAKEIEMVLRQMYSGSDPNQKDVPNLKKIYEVWNRNAPAEFRF